MQFFDFGVLLPEAVADYYRCHDGFAARMPEQGLFKFLFCDVVRGEKIAAEQEQDEVGLFQLLFDGFFPVFTGHDFAVVPKGELPSPFQWDELFFSSSSASRSSRA